MPAEITPLDPDSEKGRQVTEQLSDLLAQFRVNIAARKAAAQRAERDEAA